MPKRGNRCALAVMLGLSLVAGIISPAGATSAVAEDEPLVKAAKVKPVRGSNYEVIPRKSDLDVDIVKAPAVVWPAAGAAEVALPEITWAARLSGVLPKKAAGTLPLAVGPTADGTAPSKIKVEMLGRRGASLLVKLTSADKTPGKVSLEVDYQPFRYAYGGDWATRLRLVQLPSCAEKIACTGRPIPTRNTGSGKLSADVTANGLFAVEAAAAGPAGDFSSTQLSPTASWSVGGSSGDFNWQYPLRTPPGTGGPTAEVSLGYSSGSVDGRTSGTNNQTSWAGEGFELSPGGSIERRYASCSSKSEQSGNNGTKPLGDLCFATDNATFTLNGKGGELVLDDVTKQWRPKADDGTKVERLSGTDNGDQGGTTSETGEYWVITTKDGTKFYFGLNKIPSPNAQVTNSTWTVPVAGNHANEQCHQPAFANSFCQQAYRWNLDYVVDPHGNTMSLFYETEKNNYARNGIETTVGSYDRGGNIKRIDYGQTAGQVFTEKPVARIHFDTAQRCAAGAGCAAADYFDTPLDQECLSTTRCTKFSPSFWTKKKLTKVRTEVWRPATGFDAVDTWTLRHSFPNPGDNTGPRLWLEAITHTGEVGSSALSTPEVNFDKIQLNNRVSDGSGQPLLDWFRISAIHYGTGGELAITYSDKDCSLPGNVPPVDQNNRRCHPMKWTPPGAVTEREDWFHKYVVMSVTESDRVSGMLPVVTTIKYPRGPAWRHDDEDGLVEIGRKTWSQWRGYDRVVVTKGPPSGPQSVTEHRYFQGMDGDKLKSGGVKDVLLEDSTGALVEDRNAFAGQERESSKVLNGAIAERTITEPWLSPATATRVRTWGTTQAFKVEQQSVRQWEAKSAGGFRETLARNEYTPTGVLTRSTNANDLTSTSDDTCTRYEYVSNSAKGIAELPSRTHTVAKACDQPWTKDDVITDEKLHYSGAATPVNAKPTAAQRLSGFTSTGTPTFETVRTLGYDDHGRKLREIDAKGRVTTYSYLPADGPVTMTSVKLANGHVSSTELEPAWGQATTITDVGGRRTLSERDALGRIAKVWLPGRAQSQTPNVEHSYFGGVDKPGVVRTRSLQTDGTVETSYELLDGLQRKRQIQRPAADGIGRVITDVEYDSRGLAVIENSPYYNEAPPGDVIFDPVEELLPARKATSYDGMERPTKEAFWSFNDEKWSTTHTYEPDRQTVNPPEGEQATTKITDVQGRQSELRTYNTADPSANFDKTSYSYTKSGQLAMVTDPAGNLWRNTYDIQGRRIKVEEPDRGTTTFTYNEVDQITSSTDAKGNKLFMAYDLIGRPTTVRESSVDGPLRVERTYDSPGAVGSLSSATRYVNGQAYTTRVTGYSPGGQPTGTSVTIPAAEGALAATYTVENTYTETGLPETTTMPAVGGLPRETLKTTYDTNDLPTGMSSELGSYVTGTEFNSFGDLTLLEVKPTNGKWLRHSYLYDEATRRLSRAISQRETAGPQRVLDQQYSYDHAGNVTKIVDAPATGSTEPKDTQCFDYDELRRLTQAWTPGDGNCLAQPTNASQLGGPASYWHSWSYDKIGNRKSETRTTTAGVTTSTYEYPATGQPRPHAVQKITTTGPAGTKVNQYGYDAAGNQTSRTVAGVGETFEWDAEGKLTKVAKGAQQTKYVYDADGNRLLRQDNTGTTLYLGSTEVLLKPDGSQIGTRHYTFGKQTIGVRSAGKLTWLGSDHHGSATLMVDAETQAFGRRRSTPFGESRGTGSVAWPSQRDFVGGTKDASTGLVHLGAREYDPTTGRFLSVDPVVDPGDPQQLNGYAYANNSPTSFVDADGKRYKMETVTELKTIVRWHTKRIKELQRTVITVYVKVVVYTFASKLAAAFGFHDAVRRLLAEVARQVTVFKEIVRTIRYHTKEVIRVVTRRFIKESGPDAVDMARALSSARATNSSMDGLERKADQLAIVARQVGLRAQAARMAAEANRKQVEEQKKKEKEPPAPDPEVFGRDTYTDTGTVVGGAVGTVAGTAAGVWVGAKIGATAGLIGGPPGAVIGGAVGAATGALAGYWTGRGLHAADVAGKTEEEKRLEQMYHDNPCSNIMAGC